MWMMMMKTRRRRRRRRRMTIGNNNKNRVKLNMHAKFTLWRCMCMGNDKLENYVCIKFNR
jgi:hypothetical protein